MEEETVVVRKVNKSVYRQFRQKAIERRLRLGRALTNAMEKWTKEEAERNKVDPKNLLKLEGIIKTKGPARWSEEVDEILYGWKK